jgi:hypothetical protein
MLNTRAADNGSAQMPNGSGSSGEFVQKGQGESPEDASLIYSDDNPDPSAQYGATPPYTPPPTSLDKDLGLSADPTMDSPPRVESPPVKDEDSGVYGVFDPLNRSQSEVVVPKDPIVPRKSGPSKKKLIILAAAIIIALCVVGTLFLNLKPASDQKAALQSQSASLEDGADEARGPLDNQPPNPNTTEKLNFKEDETSHFIRTNLTSGKLLIITGRITNDFPDRRSFIRVRGILKNPDGVIEAERQSYAGNYLSETELTSLPINEILSRLAIKGGQNGLNMNLDPGASISFMLVFDKIPVDLVNYEYVVDVVSSTSAGPPVASTPPQNEPAT